MAETAAIAGDVINFNEKNIRLLLKNLYAALLMKNPQCRITTLRVFVMCFGRKILRLISSQRDRRKLCGLSVSDSATVP